LNFNEDKTEFGGNNIPQPVRITVLEQLRAEILNDLVTIYGKTTKFEYETYNIDRKHTSKLSSTGED
jgi:hypothetical protein